MLDVDVNVLSNGILIPPAICDMRADVFLSIWQSFLSDHTHEEAYNKMEEVHIYLFGRRRYSSYDSFRKCMERKFRN